MTYLEFVRKRFGSNWVVATRCTDRILRQYGTDVCVVLPKKMQQTERDYRTRYGDPHDAIRAQMYRALRACRSFLTNELQSNEIDPDEGRAVLYVIESAIKAEQERA